MTDIPLIRSRHDTAIANRERGSFPFKAESVFIAVSLLLMAPALTHWLAWRTGVIGENERILKHMRQQNIELRLKADDPHKWEEYGKTIRSLNAVRRDLGLWHYL